jgi:hypothetical protein
MISVCWVLETSVNGVWPLCMAELRSLFWRQHCTWDVFAGSSFHANLDNQRDFVFCPHLVPPYFTIVGDIIYKYETIQNDRGAWSESLFNQYYNESMIPDSWMLVMSPNGVRPIWSAGFIFLFWWYRSTLRRVYIRLFSSASVQTKHELPMWNVRVWDTS